MSEAYVGEIRVFAGNFAPLGWALCDGTLLPIADNQVLFTLIGTTYGGDGQSTFALPDLRGRAVIHQGTGPGLSPYVIGEQVGQETITLVAAQMPATHTLSAGPPLLGTRQHRPRRCARRVPLPASRYMTAPRTRSPCRPRL